MGLAGPRRTRLRIPKTNARLLPILGGPLGVGEFFVAAVIAALFDEFAGFCKCVFVAEEAGSGELDVGHVQTHRTTLGDLPRLVEVLTCTGLVALDLTQPGASEKTARNFSLFAASAETADGVVKVLASLGKPGRSVGDLIR